MPEITVALTTYNLENYIRSCFEELKKQTFQDFEILVYDDCSCDGTREILSCIKGEIGNRLHIIYGDTPQKLPAKSRNKILDSGCISGKYIVFLDGDDSIEPDFLEALYLHLKDTGADLAFCAYDRFEDETGHVLCQEMRGYPSHFVLGTEETPSLAFINTSLWNKLICVDRIADLRMPEFSVGEDASFLQALYARCSKIACVDQILIHYRVRAASVISNTPEESIYRFANELAKLSNSCNSKWLRDNIAFAAFIHIGLSMMLRAYDNPDIDTGSVLRWIQAYFKEYYSFFAHNPYLKLKYLLKHKIKGLGIWGALLCYRLHIFPFFLWLFKTATTVLHTDIKF